MGTRSLTVIMDDDEEVAVLYRQFDGYIDGHGKELAEFCKYIKIVNGLSCDEENLIANGMGCLAAQIVSHFKTNPGAFYLYPAGTRDCGEDYIYTIYKTPEGRLSHSEQAKINIKVINKYAVKIIFDGSPEDLLSFEEPEE